MNTTEFKNLNNDFLSKLKEAAKAQNASVISLGRDPLSGDTHIGIYYKDSPNFKEVYLLRNNGNIAEWKFIGVHNG